MIKYRKLYYYKKLLLIRLDKNGRSWRRFLQKIFVAGDVFLDPQEEGGVPRIESGDRVVLFDLLGERVHVVVFGATDQTLQKM